MKTGLNKFK